MAECSLAGTSSAFGRARSRADSTRAWIRPIHAVKSVGATSIPAGSVVRVGTGEILERVFLQDLHLLLRLRQQVLAVLRQLQAAPVRLERLLEAQLAGLHACNDLLELGERSLEAGGLLRIGL